MKKTFQAIGLVLLVLWLLGITGITDFRLCIGARGTCNPIEHAPAAVKKASAWRAAA